ncbi:MAG: hypothetical protein QOD86_2793 [Miltoncostaeaceae bacterium]|nr:hypothetical protein [Miltoncostaeaceae bacterium]
MIHPLLERQLRGLGLDAGAPPDAEAWAEMLRRITRAYEASDRGRYLVERSLEISSTEMRELYEQLRASSESELARERDYAAALVGSMQDGLTVLSPEAVLTEVSPSFCAMTGFSQEELIGVATPFPYWPGSDRAVIERGMARVREEGSAEWDLQFRRRDGTNLSVILAASLLRGEGGRIVGYLATIKDVTARKRAEVRLAASGARNRRLAAEQAALRRVATAVAREATPGRAFALIAEEVAGLLDVDCGLVVRYEADRAVPVGWCGAHQEEMRLAFPLGGEGALARVRRTGRPVRIADYGLLADDSVGRIALARRYRSGVAAPVAVGGRIWGAVLAATTLEEPIAVGAEARLAMFAELAALAIANAEARGEIDRTQRELRAQNGELAVQRARLEAALDQLGAEKERLESFSAFGERIAGEIALGPLTAVILEDLCRIAGADGGTLHAGEPGPDGSLPLAATWGAALARREAPRAELRLPLGQGARTLGALALTRAADRPFSDSEAAAIEHLCDHAAMALAHALSLQRVQRQAEVNQSVLETAHDGWVAVDDDGLITGWNPRSEEIFGWTADEAIGRPLAGVLPPPERRTAFERVLARLLAEGGREGVRRRAELVARRRDGREVPVEVTVSAVPSGGPVALHAFVRDIGDRRRAERREAAQHAVARVLAEAPSEEAARPRLLEALGESLGWRAGAFWTVDATRDALVRGAVWGVGAPTDPATAERAWRAGEPVVTTERGGEIALAVPIAGEGATLAVLQFRGPGIGLDERELRSTLAAVDALIGQYLARKRMARETERLKDEFVALVSHELRTPLTSIIGYLEVVLDEEELDPAARRWLQVVERNAHRLLRLVGDLLFIARMEAGQLALDAARPIDLVALAEQSVQAAQPHAEGAGVTIALAGGRPDAPCWGDADRIAQVLDNLVSNALKFTPSGGRVDVRLRRERGAAVIEVADTGVGIPAGELESLFQRFFRASTATRDKIAGVGLGLSIAKAIVEAHGGAIEVESEEGAGATFRVRLPLGGPAQGRRVSAAAPRLTTH